MTEQKIFPHLAVNDGNAAIEFYKKGLGAEVKMNMPAQDGRRVMHATLSANGAEFMLHSDFDEYRDKFSKSAWSPKATGGTTVTIHLEVENADAAMKRMTDAGATVLMGPDDMFWGARYGQVIDPFGHVWSFAHPLKKA